MVIADGQWQPRNHDYYKDVCDFQTLKLIASFFLCLLHFEMSVEVLAKQL